MRLLASIAVAVLASATVAQAQMVCLDSGPCGVRADPRPRVLVCSSEDPVKCTFTGGWCPYNSCRSDVRGDTLVLKFKADGYPGRGVPLWCPDGWAPQSATLEDGRLEVICRHVVE